MATLSITLPEAMRRWAEKQARSRGYASTSEYLVELLRRDQKRIEKIARTQTLVEEGFESGVGCRSMEELRAVARKSSTDE